MPRSVLRALAELTLPRVCLVCGRHTTAKLDCCPDCEGSLPTLNHRCISCGLGTERPTKMCNTCLLGMPAFDQTWPGFEHAYLMQRWIRQFRGEANLTVGRFLSDVFARRLAGMGAVRPDLLVPMPLHSIDYFLQGFDHNRWLCQALSKRMQHLPTHPALKLTRRIKKQHSLPTELRWANVKGAYAIRSLPPKTAHVALIDDVMTTGHSVNEAAGVLKKAGVRRVDVWVLARD